MILKYAIRLGKSIFCLIMFSTIILSQETDTFEDNRDSKSYKIVTIGNQVWMAENLNFETTNSWCYELNPENCSKYGRLYTWEDAKNNCPKGWHLPSLNEWQELIVYLGGEIIAGSELLSGGNTKFNALMGGIRSSQGKYLKLNDLGMFWTSTELEDNIDIAWMFVSNVNTLEIYSSNTVKSQGFSVRCIKDSNEK